MRASVGLLEGYKQDFWEWTHRGQEFIYSVSGFRDYEGHFGGTNVIDYEQTLIIPYVGLHLEGEAKSKRAFFSVYGLYSPVAAAEDKDHHILRKTHFEESFEGGDFFAAGFSGTYLVNPRLSLTAALEYQDFPTLQGDMRVIESGEHFKDAAGIANYHITFSSAVGCRF